MALRCKLGEMARVARNTQGGSCDENLGTIIYCDELVSNVAGPAWLLRSPRSCPKCGGAIFGFLDADLDPIRPPGKLHQQRRDLGVEMPA